MQPNVELELQKLASLVNSARRPGCILAEDMRRGPAYEVPGEQWAAIKQTLDDVFARLPGLKIPFEFHSRPGAPCDISVHARLRNKRQLSAAIVPCGESTV